VRITQAQISLSASLKMGTGVSQSGPVENPSTIQAGNGLFDAAVVFTTATGNAGNWALAMQVQGLPNQMSGNFVNTVNVAQVSPAKAYSVVTQGNSDTLFVCLVQPTAPQIGVNNFEVVIYRQISAVAFAAGSNYNLMIDAEMPLMTGMNSPNNVNPAYTSNGHYLGKVDFIMSGEWQINLNLSSNGALADSSHYFDLSL
jgi:hypothetical protein